MTQAETTGREQIPALPLENVAQLEKRALLHSPIATETKIPAEISVTVAEEAPEQPIQPQIETSVSETIEEVAVVEQPLPVVEEEASAIPASQPEPEPASDAETADAKSPPVVSITDVHHALRKHNSRSQVAFEKELSRNKIGIADLKKAVLDVEDAITDIQVKLQVPEKHPLEAMNTTPGLRQHHEIEKLFLELSALEYFNALSGDAIRSLCQWVSYRSYAAHRTVAEEGNICDALIVVYSGGLELTKKGQPKYVGKVLPGHPLNHMEMTQERVHDKSSETASQTELLFVEKSIFDHALREDAVQALRLRVRLLRQTPLFVDYSVADLLKVAETLHFRQCHAHQALWCQSDVVPALCFVLQGQLRMIRRVATDEGEYKLVELQKLHQADFFGEEIVTESRNAHCSIVTDTWVVILEMSKADLLDLGTPSLLEKLNMMEQSFLEDDEMIVRCDVQKNWEEYKDGLLRLQIRDDMLSPALLERTEKRKADRSPRSYYRGGSVSPTVKKASPHLASPASRMMTGTMKRALLDRPSPQWRSSSRTSQQTLSPAKQNQGDQGALRAGSVSPSMLWSRSGGGFVLPAIEKERQAQKEAHVQALAEKYRKIPPMFSQSHERRKRSVMDDLRRKMDAMHFGEAPQTNGVVAEKANVANVQAVTKPNYIQQADAIVRRFDAKIVLYNAEHGFEEEAPRSLPKRRTKRADSRVPRS